MIINLTFDPVLAQIGPVTISWQGLFTAIALALAILLSLRSAEQRGMSARRIGPLAVLTLLGGIACGRLANVLAHLLYYAANPAGVGSVWDGGMSLYGALLGGALVLFVAAWRAQLPPWSLLDAATPAALVGVALGRVGCLLAGAAWGTPTGGAWGVIYWHPHDLLAPSLMSTPLHPYPLYESLAVLLLLACLGQMRRRVPALEGNTFLLAAIGYAIATFGLAAFRAEPPLVGELQAAQVMALAGAAAFCLILFARSSRFVRSLTRTKLRATTTPPPGYTDTEGDIRAA